MKNILITALLLLTCLTHAQVEESSEKWQKIDSLEILGLVESADELTKDLIASAKQKEDHLNFLKAKIYHYKFHQIRHENSTNYILNDLNDVIEKVPAPYENILLSYKASFLEQYFQEIRWKSRNRSTIDNPDSGDLETWSLHNLQDSIQSIFEKSLKQEKELISTFTGEVETLLNPNYLNRQFKPTLFDVLAHRAIEYYSNTSNFTTPKPQGFFSLNSPELYSPTPDFASFPFPEASKNTSTVKVLKIYQKLEKLHLEERNTLPLIFAQLSRLQYVNDNYSASDKWQLFNTALDRLKKRYKNKQGTSLILVTRALDLYERSIVTDEEGKLENPDFLKQALYLAEKITNDYPNTDAAQRAYQLISAITAVKLDAKIPQTLSPKEPGRVYISYKALDSLEIKIFQIPENFPSLAHLQKKRFNNPGNHSKRTAF
ncbi:hypothetical protein LZ575_05430 [Antarcticibacterium sp. 1MA-6-2]|uniref:hypothetical protein n=1 Tax=Antarcticibacterium sp. 1MA-6-2 TaxID=2908210 RepID=UPI001F1E2E69|nr:hypothetical protein [Antarcticibacterium sp. 1MA-6-2]UJH92047.1 hypothetical protein LZ575_05430 [Antarcticibacterium sp. 1MA-6-2]